MDFEKIKCFLSVANRKSFSRAAQELYMAQSSVSQQIKSMENELGFAVLERNRKSVRLTPAGEYLRIELTKQLNAYQGFVRQAMQIARESDTSLIVGYPNPPEWGDMPSFLQGFRSENPGIQIGLRLDKGRRLVESFCTGEIDVLFGDRMYFIGLHDAEVTSLFKAPAYVLIPNEHPLCGRETVSVQEINRYKAYYRTTDLPDTTTKTLISRLIQAGVDEENILPARHREDVEAYAYAGIGLGIVPGTVRRSVYRVHVALLDAPNMYFEMSCAMRKGVAHGAARVLIEAACAFDWP